MKPMIELEDIELEYRHNRVLQGLTLSVQAGEFLALLGPSGGGKSTVLRLILGFVAPTRGQLRIAGEPVSRDGAVLVAPEERGLAVVFQDLALWPHLNVHQNLAFGLAAQGVCADERECRIAAMLNRVALRDKAYRSPGALSGGERQRVAIARALVLKPQAVLLDEPLANVDVALKWELLDLFNEVLTEHQITTIYVTHNLSEAMVLGDRATVLEAGRIVEQGTLDEFRAHPATPFVQALVDHAAATGTRRLQK
ncbi:MAG: ABC transporter ATP-binding protein [Gammaproteobacteria bacterium]